MIVHDIVNRDGSFRRLSRFIYLFVLQYYVIQAYVLLLFEKTENVNKIRKLNSKLKLSTGQYRLLKHYCILYIL